MTAPSNPFRRTRYTPIQHCRINLGDLAIHYSIRLSESERDCLKYLATQNNLTLPSLTRYLIRRGLESKAPWSP